MILPLIAQSNNDSFLYWNERKLDWKDFQGIAPSYNDYTSSEIKYGLGYRTFKREINDIEFSWIETYSYMDKKSSWVAEDYKSPDVLLYNQIIFNIAELYSRKMQEEINSISGSIYTIRISLDEILKRFQQQCNSRVENFIASTEYGAKTTVVNYWKGQIETELDKETRIEYPPFTISDWGFGFSFDLGYGILTGSGKNYFSNPGLMAFDFDIQYKSTILFLRGLIGFNSVKQDFLYEDKQWTKGLNSGTAIGDLSVGYPLINSNRFIVTPYAGIGIFEFAVREKSEEYKKHHFTKATVTFGINCDYIFNKKIDFFDDFFSMGKSHWMVRTRLTAAPFNFDNGIEGWSFNLTVGLGIFSNSISK